MKTYYYTSPPPPNPNCAALFLTVADRVGVSKLAVRLLCGVSGIWKAVWAPIGASLGLACEFCRPSLSCRSHTWTHLDASTWFQVLAAIQSPAKCSTDDQHSARQPKISGSTQSDFHFFFGPRHSRRIRVRRRRLCTSSLCRFSPTAISCSGSHPHIHTHTTQHTHTHTHAHTHPHTPLSSPSRCLSPPPPPKASPCQTSAMTLGAGAHLPVLPRDI